MTKSKNSKRVFAILVPVLGIALLAPLALSHWRAIGSPNGSSTGDQWISVNPEPLEVRLGLLGRLEPATTSAVVAPFEGNISQISVDEGDSVTHGQSLVSIDTARLDVQIRTATAALLKARQAVHDLDTWADSADVTRSRRALSLARITLADTERKLADARALFERGIVPRMEVDTLAQLAKQQSMEAASAVSDLDSVLARGGGDNRKIADMELANAQSKVDELNASRASRDIRAPFSGVVVLSSSASSSTPPNSDSTNRFPHKGMHISQGQALFDIANAESLKAVARVNEADVNSLRPGQAVEISGDAFPGIMLKGRIASIGIQSLRSNSGGGGGGTTYEVVVKLDDIASEQRSRLRLGMTARLSIVVYRNERAYIVPPAALSTHGDGTYVTYRDTPDGPIAQARVKVGRGTPRGVEVSGLNPGYVLIKAVPAAGGDEQ